jgi:hypothetical protein
MSYEQLRAAYVERVHEMHPDKAAHRRNRDRLRRDDEDVDENDGEDRDGTTTTTTAKFVELKDAWEAYARVVRGGLAGDDDERRTGRRHRHRRRGRSNATSREGSREESGGVDDDIDYDIGGGEGHDNFTMFGVGCSFADSPEESARRAEIMDQACRGWFPSGSIPARGVGDVLVAAEGGEGDGGTANDDDGMSSDAAEMMTTRDDEMNRGRVSLIDEGMFVSEMDERRRPTNEGDYHASTTRMTSSLVQDADKFRRGTMR